MYAIKITLNNTKPNDWYILRDPDDFVAVAYTRRSVAEQLVLRLLAGEVSNKTSISSMLLTNEYTIKRCADKKARTKGSPG
jgi:hypothetical protein|tara:strand:- start:309 stop:551 length:243 start_codon:yes stop_codon:yes gene_type:complete